MSGKEQTFGGLAAGGEGPRPAASLPRRYRAEVRRQSLAAKSLAYSLAADPRPPVADPNAEPFNSICLVHGMVAADKRAREAGTGWLIHPRIVITSAHVLTDPKTYSGVAGHRAAFARLWFGIGPGERWGDFATYRIHPEYIPSGGAERYDIAAILLPSPAPMTPLNAAAIGDPATEGATVGMVGFPYGERPMKSGAGTAHVHGPLLGYGVPTAPGDSGGPVFLTQGAGAVLALHTAWRDDIAVANRLRAELMDPLIGDLTH